MLLELKTELEYLANYIERGSKCKCNDEIAVGYVKHAQNLVKILKDRAEIAEAKVINGNKIEQRTWKEVSNEYDVIENMEKLYNGR